MSHNLRHSNFQITYPEFSLSFAQIEVAGNWDLEARIRFHFVDHIHEWLPISNLCNCTPPSRVTYYVDCSSDLICDPVFTVP